MSIPHTFFQGLRVVELASVLAGPAVGQFFAELGAAVIKIENRTTDGDVTRRWKLPAEDPADPFSAYYHSINYGKEALLLDLEAPSDRAALTPLLAAADVVIANFRPAAARRLGLDYDRLHAHYPSLIYAELFAYGPDDERPAFDVVLQAETGFLSMTGEPGGPPVKMPVALIDLLAAHQLKEGILLALLQRERTGQGAHVTTSLYAAALSSLANQATNWLVAGHVAQPMGTRHPNIAPYGDTFTTRDGKLIVLAVGTEAQFRQLCGAIGLELLTEDQRFADNKSRVAHRATLNSQLATAIGSLDHAELLAACRSGNVPIGTVKNMQEVLDAPEAAPLLLEREVNGRRVRSVRTVVFTVEN